MNRWQLLLTVAILVVLASCSGNPRVTEPQAEAPRLPEGPTIRQVEPVVAEDRTRVVVRADFPLNYTSYAPDAATLVVEMPNANGSLLPSTELPVGSADVDSVRVERFEDAFGGQTTRMTFTAPPGFKHEIHSEGNELWVEIMGPQHAANAQSEQESAPESASLPQEPAAPAPGSVEEELAMEDLPQGDEPVLEADAGAPAAASASDAQAAPAAPAAARSTLPPAHKLARIRVQQAGASPRITLEGDGAFQYETFQLSNPARLVIDLKQVTNEFRQPRLTVSSPLVSAVRVAQFKTGSQPVARVVFDLAQPTPFQVVPDGRSLDVLLGAAAQDPPAPSPQVVASSAQPSGAPAEQPASEASSEPALAPAKAEPEIVETEPPAQPLVGSAEEAAAGIAAQQAQEGEPLQAVDGDPAQLPDNFVDSQAEFVPLEEEKAPAEAPPASPTSATRTSKVTDIRMTSTAFEAKTIAGEERNFTGKRISISFRDADLKDVFRLFHEISGLNIVLDPGVAGKITIILDNVPWDQALDIILKNNGLDKVYENNLIRIATTQKLAQEAASRKALKEAQELEVEVVTFTRQVSYADAAKLLPVVKKILSKRGDLIHDPRTNMLVISDVPSKKEPINRLIDTLDTATPQVMIEARIIETDRNFEQDFGITWGFTGEASSKLGTQTNLQFPHNASIDYAVSLAPPATASTLGLSFGNVLDSVTLGITLDALELNGNVRILSAPRIATQSNERATIEQGVQIPIVNTTATEINVEFISASLKLEVTPLITGDNTILLDVQVENNSPDFVNRVGTTPPIITERAQTKILIKNGGTAVIGGIYKINDSVAEKGVPGLRRLPLLGWLFKNKSINRTNSELLVFLTPRIL